MSKKFPAQLRLTNVERVLDQQRHELMKTSDRSSVHAAKRHIVWARTFDDGNYPPDPGGQSQQPHVLPVVFLDVTYGLQPGPASVDGTPLDVIRMDYALCSQWYEPDTSIPVFHQNRRWFEIGAAGSAQQGILQPILIAIAKLDGTSSCANPLPIKDIVYRPFGIFQIPWGDPGSAEGQTWASGEPITWSENDEQISWSESGAITSADNPAELCGMDGDAVILHYQGEGLLPLVLEIKHYCYDIQEIEYDPVSCLLGYKNRSICTPVTQIPDTQDPLTTLIDFYNQTFVVDAGWDQSKCSLYVTYQDFCVIGPNTAPMVLDYLDFRDIQDPCCPCPPCPTDCDACPQTYNLTIQTWSTPDCGCMDLVDYPVGKVTGCRWAIADPICDLGTLTADIYCLNRRWVLKVRYSTTGVGDDVTVETLELDMGPASDLCPPSATFNDPLWQYQGGSYICIDDAEVISVTPAP